MNILLLGSGGREHALAHSLQQGKHCSNLYIAPGNPGTAACGTNIALNILDFQELAAFCADKQIGMLVVGPEEPLVKGLRDYLEADGRFKDLIIIGPGAAGARLEGSKDFAKAFMVRHGIPTARYRSFQEEDLHEALAYIDSMPAPFVLKASGLAAGKGVLILENAEEAKNEASLILKGKFGDAGKTLVIEEFLDGIECSVFALTDGTYYMMLPEAKDYKRIGEGDTGLNTGGMGAVSPVPFYSDALDRQVKEQIIGPTIMGLKQEGIPYQGFIFFGLMISNGAPYVIEYNCRLGDPETEVVIPRIRNDLSELLLAAGTGRLNQLELETDKRVALTVVSVSEGYPGTFQKGYEIFGLDAVQGSKIYQAGTREEDGHLLTNGGRVLACTSFGDNIGQAATAAYAALSRICYNGIYFRRDIGADLVYPEAEL